MRGASLASRRRDARRSEPVAPTAALVVGGWVRARRDLECRPLFAIEPTRIPADTVGQIMRIHGDYAAVRWAGDTIAMSFSVVHLEPIDLTCAACGDPAEGNDRIHRDGAGRGPLVALCDPCAAAEVDPATIWARIRERRVGAGEAVAP